MSVRLKIITGFIILASLLVISGLISIYELTKLGNSINKLLENNYKSIDYAKQMSLNIELQKKALLLTIEQDTKNANLIYKESSNNFEELVRKSSNNLTQPGEVQLIDSISILYTNYKDIATAFINSKNPTLNKYLNTLQPQLFNIQHYVELLITTNQQSLQQVADIIKRSPFRSILPGLIVIISSVMFSIIFNYMISYYIIKPIIKMTESINNYIKYKRPFEVNVETKDEVFRLREAIKSLISLKNIQK